MCTRAVLDEITSAVAREARKQLGDKLNEVILYGSYARGDFDEESDIDIMVLADIPAEDTWQTSPGLGNVASALGLEHDVLVSVFVKDCATFNKFVHVEPFYQNVIREGVRIVA